jgi:hypothetical protein
MKKNKINDDLLEKHKIQSTVGWISFQYQQIGLSNQSLKLSVPGAVKKFNTGFAEFFTSKVTSA